MRSLYSETQFQSQPEQSTPEILRSDLASLQQELIRWGCTNADDLAWIDAPKHTHLQQARDLLTKLKLIDSAGKATPLGQRAYQLGVEPRLASMLLQAEALGEQALGCAIALSALIEEPERNEVDVRQSLHRWQQGTIARRSLLMQRAKAIASRFKHHFSLGGVEESLLGVVAALAFPDRIALARNQSGHYLLANGHGASLDNQHRLSDERLLVALDLMRAGQGSSAIYKALPIDIDELESTLPGLIETVNVVDWDDDKGRLVASEQRRIGAVVMTSRETPVPDDADIASALLGYVRRKGLSALNWTDSAEALIQRVQCAALWLPEDNWPTMSQEALLNDLEQWLLPFMSGISNAKQLKKVDLMAALQAMLGWDKQRLLDELVPTHLTVASGNRKRIRYQAGEAPTLSVKLQEMFGEKASPTIARGTQAIVLELLSPAQRPLQITRDLAAFWQGAYKEVQKEMKGRYPKHPWPDDPMNHQATSKTKRQLNS